MFNTSTSAPYVTDDQQGFQDLVIAEAFKRLGLKARVEKYDASARALINANDGVDDGVAMRIKGLEANFPNLVRVQERLIVNDFVAYSRGLDLRSETWESLKPYMVGYINGWVIFERNLPSNQPKATVRDPQQMFAMLNKQRIDVALYERWQGLYNAHSSGLIVKVHEPPLASVDMYMYVHKKHAKLAQPLAKVLRAMKADGTYQAIYDKSLTVLNDKSK
ncbi:MAG: transporter substrate-binding domain-containing protein [Magnetovibrio sp.]|nr:transporter substrate-binding domain-containing protein [Magnetovibrio sp.]